jgi:hypothetical protein
MERSEQSHSKLLLGAALLWSAASCYDPLDNKILVLLKWGVSSPANQTSFGGP